MGSGTVAKISKVKPYMFKDIYESRMLLDDKNSNGKLLARLRTTNDFLMRYFR